MQYHSFQNLLQDINHHIGKIEYNREKYSITQHYNESNESGTVDVRYDDTLVVRFHYFRSKIIKDGHNCYRTSVTFRRFSYPLWYREYKEVHAISDVHVDEYYRAHSSQNDHFDLKHFMNIFLPISNENAYKEIETCLNCHNICDFKITFDSFTNKYIVETDIEKLLDLPKEEYTDNISLYKYASLETFRNMLNSGTYRMNSIVSMNDISETVWMDYIAGEDIKDKEYYYRSVVKIRKLLVSSFTTRKDDATMWRLYGNNGNGVCLNFSVPTKYVTKVMYVDEKNPGFLKIKSIRKALAEKNIGVEFRGLNNMRSYIKSTIFSVEGEYRYFYDCSTDEEELELACYGSLLSPYKDFKYDKESRMFDRLPFKFEGVTLGKNIPDYKTNFPLLLATADSRFPGIYIYESKVWELRG